jgi:hypothetical protein
MSSFLYSTVQLPGASLASVKVELTFLFVISNKHWINAELSMEEASPVKNKKTSKIDVVEIQTLKGNQETKRVFFFKFYWTQDLKVKSFLRVARTEYGKCPYFLRYEGYPKMALIFF